MILDHIFNDLPHLCPSFSSQSITRTRTGPLPSVMCVIDPATLSSSNSWLRLCTSSLLPLPGGIKHHAPSQLYSSHPIHFVTPMCNYCQANKLRYNFAVVSPPSSRSPSGFTWLIMSWSSASFRWCPREPMTSSNSLDVMLPSPSLSNREKASIKKFYFI